MSAEGYSPYPPELSAEEVANSQKRAEEMRELITSRVDLRQLEENIMNLFSAVELGLIPWDVAIRVLHGLTHVTADDTYKDDSSL